MTRVLIIFCLFTLALATSCKTKKHEHHEQKQLFSITNPLVKDTITTKEYVSQIHSIQHIELRALEKGYLNHVYVDEGEFVKKGQLMFQIMPVLYEAEAKKAQAEAQYAKIEYLNTKALADSNIVSQNELALSKAKYDKADAELGLANVHLSFTQIKAPFDGIVGRFHARIGSFLDEGELLTELSDNSQVWVYFNVPEAEYLNFSTSFDKNNAQKVTLLLANNQLFDHEGAISAIESDFNNETGNIAFRATFPNPKGLLRHGETGNIRIPTEFKNAMMIPQKSTFEILDKNCVFVVDDQGVIKSRFIKIEKELPHVFIIREGLAATDKILIDGLRKVKNGDKLEVEFIEAAVVMSSLELYAE